LPEFFGTLGAGDRVVDGVNCVSDLPGFSQTLGRIDRGKPHEPRSRDPGFAKLFITRSQQEQSGGDVAASDSDRSLIAQAVQLPVHQSMPLRVVEQHVRVVACRCQIPVPQRDRTRRTVQSITERDRMLCRPRIIDAVFGFAHRAIRKALQPKDSRKMDAGRNLRVELQAHEWPLVAGSSGFCERPFDMASRALLIPQVVVRDADHPLANKSIV
jgi:hypothetical protein